MPIEVEVKAKIKNLEEIEYKLIERGAKLVEIVNQCDHYFNHPTRDFGKTDEALRIREDGERVYLTYKGAKMDLKSKTRKEFSVELIQYEQIYQILKSLGFTLVLRVEKERKIYQLDNLTFCLDAVIGLGSFLEVEQVVVKKDVDIKKVRNKLIQNLISLGISLEKTTRKSYLELLLEKKNRSRNGSFD
ncbi:MAG: class IV adenylate cyclase [Candidatus Heimdallarchaeota archaeon]|nr:class IV adenylate cyclase [Candidatus Heimdallarchaeota archaeon]